MIDVYRGLQPGAEFHHQPRTVEATGIPQDLLAAFQQHVDAHQQVNLAVDHEGVILPYVYGQLHQRFASYSRHDMEAQAEIMRTVDRLSTNSPVKDLIRTLSRQDPRIQIVSASTTDRYPDSHPCLTPVIVHSRSRSREILDDLAGKPVETLTSPRSPIQPDTMFMFFNDLNVDGLPPREHLHALVRRFPEHVNTMSVLGINVPQFRNGPDFSPARYREELHQATWEALQTEPVPLRYLDLSDSSGK